MNRGVEGRGEVEEGGSAADSSRGAFWPMLGSEGGVVNFFNFERYSSSSSSDSPSPPQTVLLTGVYADDPNNNLLNELMMLLEAGARVSSIIISRYVLNALR